MKENVRGWCIVGVSFLILMFIFATCISCMGVYVKPVSEAFGIERTEFTLTITIQALAMMLSAMAAGKMLEKYNMKLLMTIGVCASAACMFIFALAPSIKVFYLASVLMGIAISFTCNIPVSMLIKNWFSKANEGLALGIAFVGSGAGSMLLNPFYTFLITNYGWRVSYGAAGAMMLVLLVPLILIFVRKGPQLEKTAERNKEEKDSMEEDSDDMTLSQAMRKGQTWAVFLAYVILTFVSMAILNHGIPFMTDSGMSPEKAAMIISVGSAALIIGKIISGALYDKFGIRRVIAFEMILLVGCFIAFWLIGLTGLMLFVVLFVVFYGIGVPVATLSMPLVLPIMFGKRHFGSIMGLFSMASGLGGMLQIVVSIMYDKTGSYYFAWIMMGILCVIDLVIFSICVKPQKD